MQDSIRGSQHSILKKSTVNANNSVKTLNTTNVVKHMTTKDTQKKETKKTKNICKQICSMQWDQMNLRSQIVLKLLLIIFLLFAIYMSVLLIIFEQFYKHDVLGHFREEITPVHTYRTSNMTLAISQRFEAFDSLTRDNVGKMHQLFASSLAGDSKLQDNPPLDYEDDVLYPESCTKGVSKESQSLVRYFDPVWINQLKLKLGWQNKLEIFSIVLLF